MTAGLLEVRSCWWSDLSVRIVLSQLPLHQIHELLSTSLKSNSHEWLSDLFGGKIHACLERISNERMPTISCSSPVTICFHNSIFSLEIPFVSRWLKKSPTDAMLLMLLWAAAAGKGNQLTQIASEDWMRREAAEWSRVEPDENSEKRERRRDKGKEVSGNLCPIPRFLQDSSPFVPVLKHTFYKD